MAIPTPAILRAFGLEPGEPSILSEMAHPSFSSYCAEQVRRYDHDRYLCLLFARDERRWALFALYAFNLELAKIREIVSEPIIGQVRLQWWREVIDGIFTGKARQHEVIQPLAQAVERYGLSREPFDKLIDARGLDLSDEPPADLAALEDYADGTSATLQASALEILAVEGDAARDAARHTGIAWALTGLIRAVPFHASAGRLTLPKDLSEAAGLDRAEVFRGHFSAPLAEVVKAVANAAKAHLAEARASRRLVPRRALPALLPAVLAGAYLARFRKAGYDPFAKTLAIGPLARQLRLAAHAALGRY